MGRTACAERAPSVSARRRADPPPPPKAVEDFERCNYVLHHAEHGGGGLMRSIETEGAVAALALQMFGALLRQPLTIIEAEHKTAEARPAVLRRAA